MPFPIQSTIFYRTGGANIGQSPRHLSPRVVQLVLCLHPYGNLSHSQKDIVVVPVGAMVNVVWKVDFKLTAVYVMHLVLWQSPSCVCNCQADPCIFSWFLNTYCIHTLLYSPHVHVLCSSTWFPWQTQLFFWECGCLERSLCLEPN